MTNPVQNALSEIYQQWAADAKDLTNLETAADNLLPAENALNIAEAGTYYPAQEIWNGSTGIYVPSYVTHNAAEIAQDQQKVDWLQGYSGTGNHVVDNNNPNSVLSLENDLSQTLGGSAGEALFTVLNTMLGIGAATSTLSLNMTQATKYLTYIFAALQDNLQADEDSQLLQDKTFKNDAALLNAAAEQMVHADALEQTDLGQFTTTLLSDYTSFNQQYDNAEVDHARYNIFQEWFGNADAKQYADDQIMANALAMENTITTILQDLSPAEAQVSSTTFTELQILVQHLMHDLKSILDDPSSSIQEKLGKILGLVMYALGLFQVIEQAQESAKTNYEKEMAQANIDATKMTMANQQANQKIVAEETVNEQIMQNVQLGATILIGAVSALMGGVGTAALMAALTILEATGEMQKATNAIADAIGRDLHNKDTGKILADVIVTLMEVAVAAGGGAALDALISKFVVEAAVLRAADAGMNASQDTIQNSLAQATEHMAAGTPGIAAAENVLRTTARKGAELAARKTAEKFCKQPVAQLIELMLKSSFRQGLKEATEKAATDAAIGAASSSKTIQLASSARMIHGSQELFQAKINEIASSAAGKSVAEIFGTKAADETANLERSTAKTALKRVGLTSLFGIGNNNLIMNIITAAENKHHDKVSNAALITAEIFQALMQALAMIAALGSGVTLTQAPVALMRASMVAQGVAQGASSAASFQMANMLDVQADESTGMQMTNAIADLLHSTLEEMQEQIKSSQAAYVARTKTESQIMNQLAIHLYDGDNAGNKALIDLAG